MESRGAGQSSVVQSVLSMPKVLGLIRAPGINELGYGGACFGSHLVGDRGKWISVGLRIARTMRPCLKSKTAGVTHLIVWYS